MHGAVRSPFWAIVACAIWRSLNLTKPVPGLDDILRNISRRLDVAGRNATICISGRDVRRHPVPIGNPIRLAIRLESVDAHG